MPGRDELHAALSASHRATLELFDLPEADLARAYAPGKWSCRQVLAHLADDEFVVLWRLCRGLAEPGSKVAGFDQDRWADALGYAQRPMALCKQVFDANRRQILELLAAAPEAAFEHTVLHSERGALTVRELLRLHAWHNDHHAAQIAAALAGRVWQPAE